MNWWHYLLLANIYLTLFFGFYSLFLRKETFFNLNRVYLVGAAILSFMIPLIQSEWIKNLFITQRVQQTFNQITPVVIYQFNIAATSNHITLGQILTCVYMSGMLILVIKLIHQLLALRRIIRESETTASYSFLGNIKMEERDADNQLITAHELAHARQLHSVDILLLEAVMVVNWFNPIVYFYRSAIKHIHEFIADRDALRAGTDKAEYAMLLLSQTFNEPPHYLVNPFFNHSMLKERIMMLQKNRSQRIALIKYGLSAPLFALMLVLSSATVNNSKTLSVIRQKAEDMLSKPAAFEISFYKSTSEIPELQHEQPTRVSNIAGLKEDPSGHVFTSTEQPASFPGGIEAFQLYLSKAVHYPEDARKNKIQGKVFVSFIVERDGALSDVKILQGINAEMDQEALNAVRQMPKWTPGVQNGMIVRQQYSVPINFTLMDDASENMKTAAEPEHNDVFTAVENSANFPGGMEKFYQYLLRSIRYSNTAKQKNLQGKVVLTFVVETDGTLTDIKVLRGINSELNNEAVRAIKSSPRWVPGMQNGRVVRQQYTVPINFTINGKSGVVRDTLKSMMAMRPGSTEQLQANYILHTTDVPLKTNADSNQHTGHSLFVVGLGASAFNSPMFIVNGLVSTPAAVAKINPTNIQSIEVLKSGAAAKAYGEKAAHGVIKLLMFKKHDEGDDDTN